MSTLREVGDNIQLLVCDGWNTPSHSTPEPNLTPDTDKHADVISSSHYNPSTQNGQLSSGVEMSSKSSDSVERPSSVNGEKVCNISYILGAGQ